jgi:hypothetical protein
MVGGFLASKWTSRPVTCRPTVTKFARTYIENTCASWSTPTNLVVHCKRLCGMLRICHFISSTPCRHNTSKWQTDSEWTRSCWNGILLSFQVQIGMLWSVGHQYSLGGFLCIVGTSQHQKGDAVWPLCRMQLNSWRVMNSRKARACLR